MQAVIEGPGVQSDSGVARLGAPEGGVLVGASVDALLEELLAVSPAGRIILAGSLQPQWGPRLNALGRPWLSLLLDGRRALDTLMDAVADPQPGDQVWLNLDRTPALDAMDLLTVEAFLAFAATRPERPLVVLLRDNAPSLARTQRLAVDRLGNILLVRETADSAYAMGQPELLRRMAGDRRWPALPAPRVASGSRHLLVLDVDGVLIEPGRAFTEAVAAALAELAPSLAWDDGLYAGFKRVGSFNNDFRLTAAALALAEAGRLDQLEAAVGIGFPDLEARIQALEPMCQVAVQKHYARSRRLERALIRRQDLDGFKGDLAIFTGRPPVELAMAFEVLGFRLPAVADSAPHLRKPRPEGLIQAADTFRAARITFVGDTCDDAAALRAARVLRPDLDWTLAAVGPNRAGFVQPGDLQAAGLRELLPHLDARRHA